MLNQIVVVGKIKELPVIKETVNGNKVATLLLEVTRNFRNHDGQYEIDLMQFTLWKGIAETTTDSAKINQYVAIKGRLQTSTYEAKEGQMYYNYELIAEKVSLL